MVGPSRKQRKPTTPKPTGLAFKPIAELRSKEEQKQRDNKIHHYTPKKKVILLPGPMEEIKNEEWYF